MSLLAHLSLLSKLSIMTIQSLSTEFFVVVQLGPLYYNPYPKYCHCYQYCHFCHYWHHNFIIVTTGTTVIIVINLIFSLLSLLTVSWFCVQQQKSSNFLKAVHFYHYCNYCTLLDSKSLYTPGTLQKTSPPPPPPSQKTCHCFQNQI